MANEAVLKYLTDTNRPYSCADVTVNLRGAFSKNVIQKTLDALSEAGKIKCKLYGKQKVYAAIQTDTVEENDIEDYDAQMKSLTQDLEEKTSCLKTAENSLKALTSTPTTSSAKSEIDASKSRIESIENKLNVLKNSTEVISADEKKTIMAEHDKLIREYRKRKRITSDMIEGLMEGYPKSKKTLLDELGIETDEMVNFKLMS